MMGNALTYADPDGFHHTVNMNASMVFSDKTVTSHAGTVSMTRFATKKMAGVLLGVNRDTKLHIVSNDVTMAHMETIVQKAVGVVCMVAHVTTLPGPVLLVAVRLAFRELTANRHVMLEALVLTVQWNVEAARTL